MTDPVAAVARRAAARLVDLDPNLPAWTERALAGGDESAPTRSFDAATTIALASLLVSIVQTAWTLWRDVKEDRETAAREAAERAREVVARRLRLAFPEGGGVWAAERDRMIAAVIEELEDTQPSRP
jgi:hypothetical protein